MAEIKDSYVTSKIANGIGEIEFYTPASNSLPGHILDELAHKINDLGTTERVRVIVLKSGGHRAFCAGASFDELVAIKNREEGHKFFRGFAKVINSMRKCPKFIIIRVQGKAVGGGVGLVAAADYAIATNNCSIKLSELALGIGPFVVGPAVQRKVGVSCFSQLAIDATEWRSAEWAKKHGLFSEIHSNIGGVDESVRTLSAELAKSSPEAMKQLKKVFWKGTEDWDHLLDERAAISGELVLSDFTREAIEAFKK